MMKAKIFKIVSILAFVQFSFEFNVDVNKSSRSFIQPSNAKLKKPDQFFGSSFFVERVKANSR